MSNIINLIIMPIINKDTEKEDIDLTNDSNNNNFNDNDVSIDSIIEKLNENLVFKELLCCENN
ncbi:hypothetical protein MYSEV_130 [Mythimna separata entomopoxvirus 'L']|uniref:Uncharacterized protein n=1 Tax=Mythimna separata entomopoxvirus 'L' TaxID=1293572 RepID=A0A916KQ91_9POXV|nr:hypothetical protein MYSEV_130 [Mythimna separata entomopoxvirus 'L']CCU56328.1 hypothetical protein MYSEV_130 [Mythimna separata entomopoxvirus 'L']